MTGWKTSHGRSKKVNGVVSEVGTESESAAGMTRATSTTTSVIGGEEVSQI